jgi:hypothetical protein
MKKHVSFAFVREKLKDSYGETGRPSIDPELLLQPAISMLFSRSLVGSGYYGLVANSTAAEGSEPRSPRVMPPKISSREQN